MPQPTNTTCPYCRKDLPATGCEVRKIIYRGPHPVTRRTAVLTKTLRFCPIPADQTGGCGGYYQMGCEG